MKLNNTQINALASKLYKEIIEERKSLSVTKDNFLRELSQSELADYKEFMKFLEKPTFKKMDDFLKGFYSHKSSEEVKSIIINKFINNINSKRKFKSISEIDIRNAIILKTIECDNLEDIISKIKKEFI